MNLIKYYRQKSGLTQQEFAQKMQVLQGTVSQWESDKRVPSLDRTLKIAEVLNVSPSLLLGLEKKEDTHVNSTEIPPEYHKVPIVGSVACSWEKGFIEEFDGDYSFINDYLYNKYGSDIRAVKAKGNSMKDVISPGDLLIVVPASDVQNDDIVIATIGDDELTAKKFHYNDSGGFDLIPVNPSYGIQSFSAAEVQKLPVNVVARVIEIRKGLRV